MWEVVAYIEHFEKGNIIHTFDKEIDFSRFNNLTSKCECCNTERYRKETYILKDENGKLMQVGTSCLSKMLETTKSNTFKMNCLREANIGDLGLTLKGVSYFNLHTLIRYLLNNEVANLKAFSILDFEKANYEQIKNTNIDEVLTWLDSLENTNNEFLHNVYTCYKESKTLENYLPERSCFNLMKYVVNCYRQHQEKILNKNDNELTGQPITIKEIYLQYAMLVAYNTYSYKYRAITTENNLVEITSSKEDLAKTLIGKTIKYQFKKSYKSQYGLVSVITRVKEK